MPPLVEASANTANTSRRDTLKLLGKVFVAGYVTAKLDVFERIGSAIFNGEEHPEILTDPDSFEGFVHTYQDTALELAESPDKPMPYEVFLAVAAHESDSGKSELAKNANNFFGVIAKDGWTGEVYDKVTEEEVNTVDIPGLVSAHPELAVLADHGDGRSRVSYSRPFRKYPTPEDSFRDFANKVYFQNADGSYRYDDVVAYLNSGQRDPNQVATLMSDNDQPNEARWATGREWLDGVKNYIGLVQGVTGLHSTEPIEPEPTLPSGETTIDVDEIDFDGLDGHLDGQLITTMKEAFRAANLDRYREFVRNGISNESNRARTLLNDEAYYNSHYRGDIEAEFIVWHLWANGVTDAGTSNPREIPGGTSHDATLSDQIMSWLHNQVPSQPSCGYLLSDNESGDLWQITPGQFGASNHVGLGIQDEGADTHPGVNNQNAIGIEVQANTIYDVSAKQFELLLYWTSKMLLDSNIVQRGMAREQVNRLVDASVIGHGKNHGLEFGYKFSRPMIQALQQFVFVAVQA